ncbi:MAG: hypothetical protein MI975_25320, partial [Cytophagales bacterium]|nr:hypothetical protein [Cytophagales bacterium]
WNISTQAQAEAGADNTTLLTPLRGFQLWLHKVQNQVVAAFNTSAKTIVGAVNELFSEINILNTDVLDLMTGKADKDNVLERDNASSFNPTQNYHPATKLYVDQRIPVDGGEVNQGVNLGDEGIGVYKDKVGVYLRFRNLKAGFGMKLSESPDFEIEIASDNHTLTVTESTGTFILDQGNNKERIFKTNTSIAANKAIDIKNGVEGSVFSYYLQCTGTIVFDLSNSTQPVYSDFSGWDGTLDELTLEGGTDSKFEIAGLFINGAWNLKVSGEML